MFKTTPKKLFNSAMIAACGVVAVIVTGNDALDALNMTIGDPSLANVVVTAGRSVATGASAYCSLLFMYRQNIFSLDL